MSELLNRLKSLCNHNPTTAATTTATKKKKEKKEKKKEKFFWLNASSELYSGLLEIYSIQTSTINYQPIKKRSGVLNIVLKI